VLLNAPCPCRAVGAMVGATRVPLAAEHRTAAEARAGETVISVSDTVHTTVETSFLRTHLRDNQEWEEAV
jgi:hypothetical protein